MYNSQYYTCEEIDQRLLQGYLDDYNEENSTSLTKSQFLVMLATALQSPSDLTEIANDLVRLVKLSDSEASNTFRVYTVTGSVAPTSFKAGDIFCKEDNSVSYSGKVSESYYYYVAKVDGPSETDFTDTNYFASTIHVSSALLYRLAYLKDDLVAIKGSIGYYTCNTASNQANKIIESSDFTKIVTGGSIKVTMVNTNTVANPTLNINNTGAKPLFYNGKRASANNTWLAGETVDIYYDGTNYMANNVAGGGGTDEVFDISVYNNNSTYDNLAAALGTNGANVPVGVRKGGMSVKFIKNIPAIYSVVKSTSDTQPTGTALAAASSIESGTYNAEDLTDFNVLPTTVTSAASVYYFEESGTYTIWTIIMAAAASGKYVQYRLMSTAWSTVINDWQGAVERLVITDKTIPDNDTIKKLNLIISNAGNSEYSERYTTWVIKNIGYSNIKVFARTPRTISCLSFFRGKEIHELNLIGFNSGINQKNIFEAEIPDDCEIITVCTETVTLTEGNPFYFNIYSSFPSLCNFNRKKELLTVRTLDTFAFEDKTTLGGTRGQAYANEDTIASRKFIKIGDYNINRKIHFGGNFSNYQLCLLFYKTNEQSTASFIIRYPYDTVLDFDIPEEAEYFRIALKGAGGLVSDYQLNDLFIYEYSQAAKIHFLENTLNLQAQKIESLNAELSDDSIFKLNPETHVALVSAKCKPNNYPAPSYNSALSFLITTDIHGDWTRFERALEYMDSEELIDGMLVLGDICDVPNELRNYDYPSKVLNCVKPVLSIPGNHEVSYSPNNTPLTDAELIDKLYSSEMIAHNGDIHSSNSLYWYRDFSHDYYIRENNSNIKQTGYIRVIGLSEIDYDSTLGRNVEFVINQNQVDWLIQTLENTPDNYYVIIISHASIVRDFNWENSKFSDTKVGSSEWAASTVDNKNFFTNIIKAWEEGGNVTETATSGDNTLTVNHSFSSAHTNKFVCFISGHRHADVIIRDKNTGYIQIIVTCTTAASYQQGGYVGRDLNSKAQDALDIITYDWFNHSVKIVRAGSDIAYDMKSRDFDAISL